jgi:hypothetical protein
MKADGTRHNDPAPDRRLNASYLNVQIITALGKVPSHMNLSFLSNTILFFFSGGADEEHQTDAVGTWRGSGLLREVDAPDGSSFSWARESEGLFSQPLYVAHRWNAEEAFVLTIEVEGCSFEAERT